MQQQQSYKRIKKPFRVQQRALTVSFAFLVLAMACFFALRYVPNVLDKIEEFIARTIDAKLAHVMVEGSAFADKKDLAQALNVQRGDSLVGFDPSGARSRLVALPWIREAVVERQLPSTLRVSLFEHQPIARVVSQNGTWVVEQNGVEIIPETQEFSYLPLLSGDGVIDQVASLFTMLRLVPETSLPRLIEAKWIGGRRFDIGFATGAWVQLPEKNPARAIRILSQLHLKKGILSKQGTVVDLRLEDRIILRMPKNTQRPERVL